MEPDARSGLSPSLAARVGPGNIRSLILEKEKELHDINEYRIRTLEALLRDKETAANAAKQKLSKLQEDFKYNLKLLEGRDEELALYDANFASLKNVLRDREAELSELRAREAELQVELQRAKQRSDEQEVQYQQKLKDARAQMEGARWKFDDELRRQQDALEAQRRNSERALREKDEDVETQRRELSVTFDDVMRQRETEFKRTTDELQAKVRDLELKNKAMARDVDAQRARAEELKTKNENLQQMLQENDKEAKSLEWTLADVRAAKDAKVGELEDEVVKLNEVKQKLLDEYESKMAELLQSLHSVEKAFVQQKAQYDEELQRHMQRKESEAQEASSRSEAKFEALATKLRTSEERVEALQAELKQVKWDVDDKLMEKEREIERAKSVLQDLEDEQQRAAGDMKQQLRTGDREAQALQERLQDAARQIALLKEKDKTQRQELLEGVENQEDLRRELVAVNLRWENQWQGQQQELDERHELRLRELQQVKDRLLGEKQVVEERLLHAENDVQRLRSELSSLKSSARITESFGSQYLSSVVSHNGDVRNSFDSIPVAPSPLWSDDPGILSPVPGVSPLLTGSPVVQPKSTTTSTGALEMENTKLRDVIRHMKDALAQQAEEMEASPGQASGSKSASKLAAQLLEAQERCVTLETQLQVLGRNGPSGNADSIALELENCQRELIEAQRVIESKTKRITELEQQITELEGVRAEPDIQSGRVAFEGQVTDLKRKLEAANSDIDRLVRERSQLMELSNQLRADLRRSGSGDTGSRSSTPRVEFAGKKDYENLVAELTQSLEEARIHNKTLKKELRRMVKLHVHLQQEREAEGGAAATSARDVNRLGSTTSQTSNLENEEGTEASSTAGGSSSAKVTDARLKLQQAKEMLMLSGKRAPVAETRGGAASLSAFAASAAAGTRLSDRETSSQRSAVNKLKQLQSKRAEMVNERKKVRNYSLGSS
ncbi:hypothetical protein BBJ29_004311 [Phytophthora kernoviae]|uniref:Uncharacterized protein n=1 Tax=Phytophthora kernoviae TaxID=325452 RepID=A0A3F2RUD4_9STRA|nr:hypothetical protein BBJ29_004311 [Phytophthora kernoviae]RLN63438.1 hypothetical protein BBP00_00004152 [Phytophthora kernoviae]